IVALSRMVHFANEVADRLARQVSCEVVDPRTTSPLDSDTILESVEKTGRLVIVDEATPRCSMAADIAALVADQGCEFLEAPITDVTGPRPPVPSAPALGKPYLPNPGKIETAVRAVMAA